MKGLIFDADDKSFETMICGIIITGDDRKRKCCIRLHKRICVECKKIDKKLKNGDLTLITPDVSNEKEIHFYMKNGLDFKSSYDKVYNKIIHGII